jgi:hypothetical protein
MGSRWRDSVGLPDDLAIGGTAVNGFLIEGVEARPQQIGVICWYYTQEKRTVCAFQTRARYGSSRSCSWVFCSRRLAVRWWCNGFATIVVGPRFGRPYW